MKSFYTILLLFTIMLVAISFNYAYISHIAQQLIQDLEELPPPTEHNDTLIKTERIQKKWDACQEFVQITVNHTEIEMISNAVDELYAFARYPNEAEFERAKYILINAIEELALSEKLSPTNIL